MKFWRRWSLALSPPKPPIALAPRPEDAERLMERFAAVQAGSYRPKRGFLHEKLVARNESEVSHVDARRT